MVMYKCGTSAVNAAAVPCLKCLNHGFVRQHLVMLTQFIRRIKMGKIQPGSGDSKLSKAVQLCDWVNHLNVQ
jgi:hypothetical protein